MFLQQICKTLPFIMLYSELCIRISCGTLPQAAIFRIKNAILNVFLLNFFVMKFGSRSEVNKL